MILVIDNYDSFVHNLARYLRLAGATTRTIRNDAMDVDAILALSPDAVVLSPGPKSPRDAGVCLSLLARLPGQTPLLGVCLGHQCLAEAFGGETARAREPMHGAASAIEHDGADLFEGVPNPCRVGRYHSLISRLPERGRLHACAWSAQGEIMALRHEERPWFGVQFHPESVLTEAGSRIVRNFVERVK